MKIKKLVTVTDEVEIDIDKEDIIDALSDNDGFVDPIEALKFINEISKCFNAVSDKIIIKMYNEPRKLIADYLRRQAKRYDV